MLKSRVVQVFCVFALMLSVTVSAQNQAVDMPESAVTDDTVLAVWVDAGKFTPEAVRQAAETINSALPEEMRSEQGQLQTKLDESMAKFRKGFKAFSEAGGKGALFLVEAVPMGQTSREPAALLRVAPGTSPEDMQNAMQSIEGVDDAPLATYQDGWLAGKEELGNVPTGGSAKNVQEFQKIFANSKASPVRMAFRMNGALKERLQKQQQNAQGNPAGALLGPMQALNVGWMTMNLGQKPALVSNLRFDSEQDATQFSSGWSNLLMMGQGMVQMQLNNAAGQNAPKPESIKGLFDELRFERNADTLTARIGMPFIQRLGEIAPSLQNLMMQMMMGGRGGGAQPAPAPQPRR